MQVLQERLRATTSQRERLSQDLQRLQSLLAQADEALGGPSDQAETLAARSDYLLEQMHVTEDINATPVHSHGLAHDRVAALRNEQTDIASTSSRAQLDL